MLFRDRADAGRRLAVALRDYRERAPLVIALPRGGAPVAYEVARALGAPLDVWIVRKVGAPWHEELGLGAVAEGGETYLNDELMTELGVTEDDLAEVVAQKRAEIDARVRRFRAGNAPPAIAGRTVIVVDDGVATGGTTRAALRAIRRAGPARLVLAVPVGSAHTLASLRAEVDDLVCLDPDPHLVAIGAYYGDFRQTSDAEVAALLARARAWGGAHGEHGGHADPPEPRAVVVESGRARREGALAIPEGARGLVLFAHGSGSSRQSPRNRFVAEELQRAGLATLLFDLLTAEEEAEDRATGQLRFDVGLLGARLLGAAEWARAEDDTRGLRLGYFGASTGAAAALIAAAMRPDVVCAIVSRGGRPDLAGPYLPRVAAPTRLIVGGADEDVLALNEDAFERLGGLRDLAVVPGAGHLFEEPGALEEVARLASDWLVRYLTP